MADAKRCPECGAELPAAAAGQPCPACLMRLGLASWQSGGGSVAATQSDAASAPPAQFRAPSIEELSRQIPELEILELIGQGGMGAVYKARQKSLGRIVALKVLKPELAAVPEFAERFAREAKSLAQLNHRNIVTVHDFGQRDGLCYLVMEYIEGANLRRVLEAGRLSPEEALRLVPDLCDALQYAHNAGVVHRDIKPENILLDRKGRVKIADFGLSKLLREEPADVSLTGTQQVMGTVRYMAPEQMQGTKGVDHRADIYSLGVVFYELLTGEVPMGRFDPPSRKVEVDVRLDEVVLRALDQEPAKRYQQASDVKTDVEAVQSTSRGAASSASLKPFAKMTVGEALRELYVPEELDKPGVPAWRKWRPAAISLAAYAAFSLLFSVYLEISLIVAIVLMIPFLVMMGTVAYKYRGTRRGRPAVLVLSLLAFLLVGIPLVDVLSNPHTLDRIYKITGVKAGAHDVAVLQTVFLLLVFGVLFSLIAYWRKLRKEAEGERREGEPIREPSRVAIGRSASLDRGGRAAGNAVLPGSLRAHHLAAVVGLTIVGMLGEFLGLIGMFVTISMWIQYHASPPGFGLPSAGNILGQVGMAVTGLFVIAAADSLYKLRRYDLCVAGSVVAVVLGVLIVGVHQHVSFFLAILPGIYAFWLLHSEETRRVFADNDSLREPADPEGAAGLASTPAPADTARPVPGEHPLMAGLRSFMTPQGPVYVRRVAVPLLILTALYVLVGIAVALAVPPEIEWAHMLALVGGGALVVVAAFLRHLWWAVKGRHLPSSVPPSASSAEEPPQSGEVRSVRSHGLAELAAVALGLGVLVPILLFIFTGDAYLTKIALMVGMVLAMLLGLLSFGSPLGRYVMLLAIVVNGAFSAVQIYVHYSQTPITYPWLGDTGFVNTAEGPALGDFLARKLGIRAPQQKEASRIFQDYYRQYVSLERRHTKHTVDDRVRITIEPFPDQMHELVTRLSEELAGVVAQRVAPPVPEKGKVHSQLGLFRFAGEARVTAELWKEDRGAGHDSYYYKEEIAWLNGNKLTFSGSGRSPSVFPERYRLYWTEPGATSSEVKAPG